jgi:hypothetical protein
MYSKSATPFLHLSLSSGHTWLGAGAADGSVHVWTRSTGAAIATIAAHKESVLGVEFSRDSPSSRLASCGADATLCVWDFAAAREGPVTEPLVRILGSPAYREGTDCGDACCLFCSIGHVASQGTAGRCTRCCGPPTASCSQARGKITPSVCGTRQMGSQCACSWRIQVARARAPAAHHDTYIEFIDSHVARARRRGALAGPEPQWHATPLELRGLRRAAVGVGHRRADEGVRGTHGVCTCWRAHMRRCTYRLVMQCFCWSTCMRPLLLLEILRLMCMPCSRSHYESRFLRVPASDAR